MKLLLTTSICLLLELLFTLPVAFAGQLVTRGRPRKKHMPLIPTPYLAYTERCDPNDEYRGIYCSSEATARYYVSCKVGMPEWKVEFRIVHKQGSCPEGYLCAKHTPRRTGHWNSDESPDPPMIDCLPPQVHQPYLLSLHRVKKPLVGEAKERAKARAKVTRAAKLKQTRLQKAHDAAGTSRRSRRRRPLPRPPPVCHAFDLNLPAPDDDNDGDSQANFGDLCTDQSVLVTQGGPW